MKYFVIFLSLSTLLSCKKHDTSNPSTDIQQQTSIYKVNMESAQKALDISKRLANAEVISEEEWDNLFGTAGYKHYLVYADSLKKKALLKECFQLAFNLELRNRKDSLLQRPLAMNAEFFKLFILHNLESLRLKSNEAQDYLDNSDFQKYIQKADSLAKRYLPHDAKTNKTKLYPLFVALMGPDGQVLNESIVLDLNLMMELGDEGVVKFFAHEFHHAYRNVHIPQFQSVFMQELNRIHQEGLADLIDKKPPPNYMTELLPTFLVEDYKSIFYDTPQILKQLDSLVVQHTNGKLSQEELDKALQGYFKFGGHPNGYYMALKIKEQLGLQVLIDSYNNPIEFLRLYQLAIKTETDEYPFTIEFMKYLETL